MVGRMVERHDRKRCGYERGVDVYDCIDGVSIEAFRMVKAKSVWQVA